MLVTILQPQTYYIFKIDYNTSKLDTPVVSFHS